MKNIIWISYGVIIALLALLLVVKKQQIRTYDEHVEECMTSGDSYTRLWTIETQEDSLIVLFKDLSIISKAHDK